MIAKRLAIPFVIWVVIVLILAFAYEMYGVGVWIIPPIIILTAIYVFSPQIDWWWYKRNPPDLDPKLKQFLHRVSPFYRSLKPEGKDRFEKRVFFYLLGNDFSGMNMEDGVPEDMKAAISIYPVTMTFNQEDFMMNPFERIVLYKHPFPSPNMRFLHACETNQEDGVILFSIEQLLQSQLNPSAFIDIGFYEYAHVYTYKFGDTLEDLGLKEADWEIVNEVQGLNKDNISKFTGFEEPSLLGSLTAVFFTNPINLKKLFPDMYSRLARYYNMDMLSHV